MPGRQLPGKRTHRGRKETREREKVGKRKETGERERIIRFMFTLQSKDYFKFSA